MLVDDRLWATVVRLCNADTEAHTPYWWATLLLKVDSDGLELESDFEYETHHVHRYPDDWNYSYDPAGSKMCLFPGCDYTIYD